MNTWAEEIKRNGLKKAYIISGEEEYTRQKAVKEFAAVFAFNLPELNHSVFEGRAKASDIIAACETLPLMDEKRLVQVRNFEPLTAKKQDEDKASSKQETGKLEDYIKIMPQSTVLLFDSEGNVDKRRKLYKIIKEAGVVREYEKPKPPEMVKLILAEAEEHGLKMSADTAAELMRQSGQDLYALSGELQKLASFIEDGKVTKADIAAYASKSLEYDVFSLHGLFMQKKAGEALALLNTVVEAEKSAFGMIGLIAYKFRMLLKARAMLDAKFSFNEIQSNLGGNPYAAKEAVAECKAFAADELRGAIKSLSDLDYALKSGQGGRYYLETVFLKIYNIK